MHDWRRQVNLISLRLRSTRTCFSSLVVCIYNATRITYRMLHDSQQIVYERTYPEHLKSLPPTIVALHKTRPISAWRLELQEEMR